MNYTETHADATLAKFHTVADELSLVEFVNYPAETSREMIHVVPTADGGVALVRNVEPVTAGYDQNGHVVTRLGGSFTTGLMAGRDDPESITLSMGDGDTLMTWCRALARERSDARVRVVYYGVNNSQMIENAGLNQETISFRYATESGIEHEIEIDNVFNNELGRMGRWA